MNKFLPAVIVMAVLKVVQSEVLTLAVLSVAVFVFAAWLLKGAAERN